MRQLTACAPTRIDFGGGWTDVPPYSDEQGGCVCNVAISRHSVVRLEALPGDGSASAPSISAVGVPDNSLALAAMRRADFVRDVRLDIRSDYPLGAGLGGSSAAGVAIQGALAAWRGEIIDRQALAESSRQLEVEDLHVAGGRQDHYAAAFGGALGLWFGGETRVQPIRLSKAFRAELERRCVVVYTGQSRVSGATITAVIDSYRQRERRVLEALDRMKSLAAGMVTALEHEDLDALGALVGEHWIAQRSLHASIPTPLIDEILARGAAAGALGGKALGASGGGCVLVIAPADGAERVRIAVESMAQPLTFTIDELGFHTASVE